MSEKKDFIELKVKEKKNRKISEDKYITVGIDISSKEREVKVSKKNQKEGISEYRGMPYIEECIKEGRIDYYDQDTIKSLGEIFSQCGEKYGKTDSKINEYLNNIMTVYNTVYTDKTNGVITANEQINGQLFIQNHIKYLENMYNRGCQIYENSQRLGSQQMKAATNNLTPERDLER